MVRVVNLVYVQVVQVVALALVPGVLERGLYPISVDKIIETPCILPSSIVESIGFCGPLQEYFIHISPPGAAKLQGSEKFIV